jgi:FMN phosphatase YigB (HAD superfamily)
LAAGSCVFVDDHPHNIRAAAALGVVGVWHQTYEQTAAELEVLFDRPLAG